MGAFKHSEPGFSAKTPTEVHLAKNKMLKRSRRKTRSANFNISDYKNSIFTDSFNMNTMYLNPFIYT